MSTTIKTPVEGFNGVVAGVSFIDGIAVVEGDAPAYFRRHNYIIESADQEPREKGRKTS